MDQTAPSTRRLTGPALVVVRAAWIATATGGVVALAASLPSAYRGIARLDPAVVDNPRVADGLAELGVSTSSYAAFLIAAGTAIAAVFIGVAVLIFLRRGDDPAALLVSGVLVVFGATWPNTITVEHGVLGALAAAYSAAAVIGFLGLVFLFPDARFVPRWTRWPYLVLALAAVNAEFGILDPGTPGGPWSLVEMGVVAVTVAVGVWSQVYRYRRVSSAVQRQQTKWVAGAVAAAIVGFAATASLGAVPLWRESGRAALVYNAIELLAYGGVFCLVPLAIGRAALRKRLWDIDPILNRALVLAGLTVILTAAYAAVVTWLGSALTIEGGPVVSFVAAVTIAVLFQPLRERLQRLANRLTYGSRDDPQRAVSALARRLDDALTPGEILPAVVGSVRDALRSPYASISMPDGAELAASGTPPAVTGLVAVPLTRHGVPLGLLRVAPRAAGEEYDNRDRDLLDQLASQAANAVEAVRLHAQAARLAADLQASRERLVSAREEERRRLRRDLHDGLGPMLAGHAMKIETARDLVADRPRQAEALLGDVLTGAVEAVAEVRRVAGGLRPPALDELGLAGAVRRIADGLDTRRLNVRVTADDLPPLPAAVEVAAYHIVGEALTNVVRHSGAGHADVVLRLVGDELHISIRDDGSGPDRAAPAGTGTVSMRERAQELGGDSITTTAAEGGTLVSATLPCERLGQ